MSQKLRLWSACVVLGVLTAGAVHAQARGRVWGVITDENGDPLEGVHLTVLEIDGAVRSQQDTNKKGRYTVGLTDATRPYVYRFEKQGYQTREETIKVPALSNERHDFQLLSTQAARAGQAATDVDAEGLDAPSRLYNEGVAAIQSKDLDTAKQKFQEAVDKDKKHEHANAALAGIYASEENWTAARDYALVALEENEDNETALGAIYQAYEGLGRDEEAAEIYERLAAMADPAVVAFNMGAEAYKTGNLDLAEQKFAESTELDPNLPDAYAALARVRYETGDFAGAVAASEKFLELSPPTPSVVSVAYESYKQLGDEENAAGALEQLKQIAPERLSQGYLEEAVQLFNANQIAEAQRLFLQVLELDPTAARAHYMLGLSYVNTGDNVNAKAHFSKFVEMAPDDPDAPTAREMMKYLD